MRETIITKSIIINGDVSELYDNWLDFQNHPQFMENITSVTKDYQDEEDIFHWEMNGPLNSKLRWTTKITRLERNKRIGWKTLEGDLKKSGQVTFTDLPNGQVELTVTSQTIPPENLIDKMTYDLFKDEEKQLEKDLRNFKTYMESGRTNTELNRGAS